MRSQPVEIVNVRLVVTGKRRAIAAERAQLARGTLKDALTEKRKVWFAGAGYATTPVYARERLPAACRITGPAIIEQMDTTTVVPPQAKVKLDRFGYLHIELEAVQSQKTSARAARSLEQTT
jgi:N-methylhydantoinase A